MAMNRKSNSGQSDDIYLGRHMSACMSKKVGLRLNKIVLNRILRNSKRTMCERHFALRQLQTLLNICECQLST